MRRLTESQYRASIADVFGPDIPVAARFERGLRAEGLVAVGTSEAGMSPFSVEQYDAAARSVAAAVMSAERRGELVPCAKPDAPDAQAFDQQCAAQFAQRYGAQLLRRPFNESDVNHFVAAAHEGYSKLGNFYDGLQYALVGLLISPEFLLRVERTADDKGPTGTQQLDAYSKATRLSYFLTNSTPDVELLQAAGAGELDNRKGLVQQVERLLASPRFIDSVRAFFTDMLELDLFDELAKDPGIYPAFNSTVAADAREQVLRTITGHLIDQGRDYRDLFITRDTYLTRTLGIIYRMPVTSRDGWEKARFSEASGRAGIQSTIAFLAPHSHPGRSSPTLRGRAIRQLFLCQKIPDPPPDVDFTVVQDPSNTNMPTARERLLAHRTEPSCIGCHFIMDPPGLALEGFDGLGKFRAHENGAPIDSSGFLDGMEFNNAEGLAQALRDHPLTPRCLVEKMLRTAVGRSPQPSEAPYLGYLLETFASSGYRVPELMRTIALSDNFYAVSNTNEPSGGFRSAGLYPKQGARQ